MFDTSLYISPCGRHYVFIEVALSYLKHFSRLTDTQTTSPHLGVEECTRLVSIFHLAVIWRDYLKYPNSNTDFIEEVDTILKRSEKLWQKSIENIMYCIIAHPSAGTLQYQEIRLRRQTHERSSSAQLSCMAESKRDHVVYASRNHNPRIRWCMLECRSTVHGDQR